MVNAMRLLPLAMIDRIVGLFVSLDPRRDTPGILARYSAFFDRHIMGVTASSLNTATLASAWRVGYHVPDNPTSNDYVVSHSSFIYLLDQTGDTVALFGDQRKAKDIANVARAWITNTKP